MPPLYQKLDYNEIRILEILPVTEFGPQPRYNLSHVTLGSTAQYQTLSYLLQASSKVEILVGECKLEVTKSCKLALEEFRWGRIGDNTTQMIWIAEICINHEDPIERQHHTSLIHQISKQAQNHNVFFNGEMQSILQFKEDELTSSEKWKKYFQNSDGSSSWHKIVYFLSNTPNLSLPNASPLGGAILTKPRSLRKTTLSILMKFPIVELLEKKNPLGFPVDNAYLLFAKMANSACQRLTDSRMILHTHLTLGASLGLGSHLREPSPVRSSRDMRSLRVNTLHSIDSEQDENKFIDQLMAMSDLENVKQYFLKTKAILETLQRHEVDITTECFNTVFVGQKELCES